jgi:hypothetical protein
MKLKFEVPHLHLKLYFYSNNVYLFSNILMADCAFSYEIIVLYDTYSDDHSTSKWINVHRFSSFIIYLRVCNQRNTAGGAETPYPSGAPEFTPCFVWGIFCSICVVFCWSLFVHLSFLGTSVLSVLLLFPVSDNSYWYIKLFSSFSHCFVYILFGFHSFLL